MPTPLSLTRSQRPDGKQQLTAAGEIDMSNYNSLAKALEASAEPVVLDLTSVDYLDSAGLMVLFAHAEHLEVIVSPLLEPVLSVSGLTDLTTVHRTEHGQGAP
ncbi:STAS domain-containing protein [Streptomyces sp. NPDC014846]|uniref:STAS domain-containing protein n=1 Tax=unclassified Streptomyces TaxID=2593676 RepID=UPI0036FE792A